MPLDNYLMGPNLSFIQGRSKKLWGPQEGGLGPSQCPCLLASGILPDSPSQRDPGGLSLDPWELHWCAGKSRSGLVAQRACPAHLCLEQVAPPLGPQLPHLPNGSGNQKDFLEGSS